MSITTGLSNPDRILHNKSFHQRNDSGELDVFEAAKYFSGYNEAAGYSNNYATYTQKIMREERQSWRGGGRISLDMAMMRNPISHHHQQSVEKQIMKEKKYKQPRSPGGRLASFLNSLFSQTGSKKKKSKSTQSMKDEEESPGGRRKRRSSISHFRSSSTADSKSLYSSSSSGFRTPPPYAHTPTKGYKEFRSNNSDHKQVISLSKYNNGNSTTKPTTLQNQILDDKRKTELSLLDEKFSFIDGYTQKKKNLGANKYMEKDRISVDDHKYPSEEKELRKLNDTDDGAESDSSSDLFELQNYDLGIYSSGLPVYETTHMDSIKRGAPISNGTL